MSWLGPHPARVSSDHTSIPWFAKFSPDGELILSGVAVVHAHQYNIPNATFSVTGRKIYSSSFIDGSLRVTEFGD